MTLARMTENVGCIAFYCQFYCWSITYNVLKKGQFSGYQNSVLRNESCVCISLSLGMYFRFFLSHYNSKKYQYCMKSLRKFSAKIAQSNVIFTQYHNAPPCNFTGKEALNWCKKFYVTCVLLENYEMALCNYIKCYRLIYDTAIFD